MVDEAIIKGPTTKEQIIDWITTGLLALVPVVVAYQGQIMVNIPPEYALLAAIGFGALSQAAAGARVRAAKDRVFGLVDQGQAQLIRAEEKIDELNIKLDEAQAKINATQMDNEPTMDG